MKHHHSHLALVFMSLAITVFVFGLFGYMYYKVDVSLDKALALRDEVRQEQLNRDQGKNLSAVYESTAQDRAKVGTYFVSDANKVPYIEMIESIGSTLGATVALSSIAADDLSGSTVGTLGHISIHVDVQGSWSAVMGTLSLAESLPYKTTVSNVRVDSSGLSDTKNPKPMWHMSFVLDAVSIKNSN